jgi:RHS repeat-associated protein
LDPNFVQPYTFTAREFDIESGLHYYRARHYDSVIGRFLQTDPIGIAANLNLYTYVGDRPTGAVDPLGLDYVDVAANYAAGFGDSVSFGVTKFVRGILGTNSVIDPCSLSYSAGEWTAIFHGIAFSGGGLLHGGAKTVLYSGGDEALEAARLAKGRLLEDTVGGKLLNMLDQHVPLPESVWKTASAVFTANAKGEIPVYLANPRPQSVWNTVEKPVLNFVNRVHTSITGSPATTVVIK